MGVVLKGLREKCNADVQTSLVKLSLNLVIDHGFWVSFLTCDAASTNISTLKELGCEFTDDFKPVATSSKHPTHNQQVYATLDALLRLAHNALTDIKIFKLPNSFTTELKYRYELHKLPENGGLKMATTLKGDHILWEK